MGENVRETKTNSFLIPNNLQLGRSNPRIPMSIKRSLSEIRKISELPDYEHGSLHSSRCPQSITSKKMSNLYRNDDISLTVDERLMPYIA